MEVFLRLGDLPLSGALLREEDLVKPEPRYPLEVAFCTECSLVQILYTVAPKELFQTDYPYFSSVSDTWVAHAKRNAEFLCESRKLDGGSLVVELASNDGYLLQHFAARGVPVLGIDPSEGPVRAAIAKGIPTRNEFFTRDLAEQLYAEGVRADVVIGNNVLAHVADLNGFVAGVARILKDDGIAVFEVPHVMELVDRLEFDTIYHEHLCYFSLTALAGLFNRHRLVPQYVEQLPTHGGSLRVYVGKGFSVSYAVDDLMAREYQREMTRLSYYANFAERVEWLKRELLAFLVEKKHMGERIAAYGAAAKGGTLLNYCGIDREFLEFVVDKSRAKQGKYMTGSRLPIYPPDFLLTEMPAYALLLVWNFKDEVLAQQAEYRRRGGKFVLPIPDVQVLE